MEPSVEEAIIDTLVYFARRDIFVRELALNPEHFDQLRNSLGQLLHMEGDKIRMYGPANIVWISERK